MKTLNLSVNKINEFIRKHYRIILTIMFSLIAIILYGSLSLHDNIWYDEAYQLVLTENNLIDIIKYVGLDHHAPFYAILLKLVTLVTGITSFVGRMVSLSSIIGCFILSFYKIKDLFSLKTSILFSCFLLSLSGIYYASIEIRPYSWSMYLTLLSSIYLLSYIKHENKRDLVLFSIFSILAMYSHNMALVYIFCQDITFFIYLMIKNRKLIKKIFFTYIVQLILYLPWISNFINQTKHVEDDFWIQKIGFIDFFKQCKELISRIDYVIYALLIVIVISVIYLIIKKTNKENSLLLISSFLFTFIFLYLISIYKMPILVPRYMVTFIGVFILVISDVLTSFNSKIWYLLIVIILLINSYDNYKYEKPKTNEIKFKEEIKYLNNSLDRLCFVHYTEFSLGEFRYYFPNAIHFYTDEIDSSLRDYQLYGSNVIKLESIEELNDMDYDTIWVINVDFVRNAVNSQEYFENWEVLEYFEYTNYYYYGKNYLKKMYKKNIN